MQEITKVTRRYLFEALNNSMIENKHKGDSVWYWAGRLEESEFLARLYNIEEMPSTDPRFKNAEGDIWQHRVNNPFDWPDDWIFNDERFKLQDGRDEILLQFLCEMLHPEVIQNQSDATKIVTLINNHVGNDGWELYEKESISMCPVWGYRRTTTARNNHLQEVKQSFIDLNSNYLQQQIDEMQKDITDNPTAAIGNAKDFIESVCKAILNEKGFDELEKLVFPKLVKKTLEKLNLVPESVSEYKKGAKTIKILLNNLVAITEGLRKLRKYYGSGHGKTPSFRGLLPRHARLAVGVASTFAIFVYETYKEQENP